MIVYSVMVIMLVGSERGRKRASGVFNIALYRDICIYPVDDGRRETFARLLKFAGYLYYPRCATQLVMTRDPLESMRTREQQRDSSYAANIVCRCLASKRPYLPLVCVCVCVYVNIADSFRPARG